MFLAGRAFRFGGTPYYTDHPDILVILNEGFWVASFSLFNPLGYAPFYWSLVLFMYGLPKWIKVREGGLARIVDPILRSRRVPLLGFVAFFGLILLWHGRLSPTLGILVTGPWILLFLPFLLPFAGFILGVLLITISCIIKTRHREILAFANWITATANFLSLDVALDMGSYQRMLINGYLLGFLVHYIVIIIITSTGLFVASAYQLSLSGKEKQRNNLSLREKGWTR